MMSFLWNVTQPRMWIYTLWKAVRELEPDLVYIQIAAESGVSADGDVSTKWYKCWWWCRHQVVLVLMVMSAPSGISADGDVGTKWY